MDQEISPEDASLYLHHLTEKYNNLEVYAYPGDSLSFNKDYSVAIAPINDDLYGFILIDHINKLIEEISYQTIYHNAVLPNLYDYHHYIVTLFREPKLLVSLLFVETRLLNLDAPVETSIDIVNNISSTYLQSYFANILRISGQQIPSSSIHNIQLPSHIQKLTRYQARQFIPSRSPDTQSRSPGNIPVQPRHIIPGKLQGIIMCHGHAQGEPNIPRLVPDNVQWTLVDINEATKPDVVAGFDDLELLSQLGFGKWDYIIPKSCPYNTPNSLHGLLYFINNVTPLLNHGGKLLINKFLRHFIEISLLDKFPLIPSRRRPGTMVLPPEAIQFADLQTKRYKSGEFPELEPEIMKFVQQAGFSKYQIIDTYLVLIKD